VATVIAALIRNLWRSAVLHRKPDASTARTTNRFVPTEAPVGSAQRTTITWEEAELLITATLLSGLIDRSEYRESLTVLAQAEDSRSPLRPPAIDP
jgi:hypothetical protein